MPLLARAAAPDVRRTVFRASPRAGVAVLAFAFYTKPRGGDMLSIEHHMSRSDTVDVAYLRRSSDYGETWSDREAIVTGERLAQGMLRRHPRAGFVDRHTGRYVEFWNEGVLPSDDPLEGMRQWKIFYRWSSDGGRTFRAREQAIQSGGDFGPDHPFPGIWTGKTCMMFGDVASIPVNAPDGRILLPLAITTLGADGKLYNPTGGYTYTSAVVLHGRWVKDVLQWEMSDIVEGDPTRVTRGMDEPTLELLEDGRMLMVLRGSNDRDPKLPSYRWVSYSSDGGHKWTAPEPWTYNDQQPFFSPSSCSQLLRHSSGRLFWLGNVNPENPRGNRPRYPLVISEVNRRTGLLQRSTVRIVDTLQPGEDPLLTLSNFYAREDRRTGEIAVHMSRMVAHPNEWAGDAYLYRIPV
jgi:hypothetical protein